MQNNSTTNTWPSSMVCDLDMTAVFFLIPEPLAMSWWKSLKLWNRCFMQHSLYTSKSAHNLLCWCFNIFKVYQWMKFIILAFTLSVGVCFRVYIRYKVVYYGLTSYIARLLPGLKYILHDFMTKVVLQWVGNITYPLSINICVYLITWLTNFHFALW